MSFQQKPLASLSLDLDNQILLLLNERAEAALKIGDLKRQRDAPVYSPAREAEVAPVASAPAEPGPAVRNEPISGASMAPASAPEVPARPRRAAS